VNDAAALVPLLVLVAGFEVWCLVEVVRAPPKVLPRWAWAGIVVVSIPLGGILFLLLGRGERAGPALPTTSGTSLPAPRRAGPDRTDIVLRTRDLAKRYGDHAALDGVSLEVPRGSVFGIVGPNGAGKTTLLSLLAGLRHATAGDLHLDVAHGKVALLPDTPHFDPWLTAWEVVDLARALVSPERSSAATDSALHRTGLDAAAHRRVGGFSRGMLQRLGLAATLVGEPELLLLDEPCSALDPLGRREVLDLVGRLGGDHTVLFCSHILDDVQEVCDAVGVLRDGRLLFQGPLSDLLVGDAAPDYVLRVRRPLAPLVEALEHEPWVRHVEQLGAEELLVRAISPDDAETHLAGVVDRAGARLVSVVPAGADLERVFLELVG